MRRSRLAAAAVLLPAVMALTSAPAWAKPAPGGGGPGGGGGGGSSSTPTGLDVSYPQCGDSLPSSAAFAIVGLNGGLANDYNSCLSAELTYAQTLTGTPGLAGASGQPPAQLYVNTADPGNTVSDWPYGSSGAGLGNYASQQNATGTTPYGSCTSYQASPACAYVYGYDMVAGVNSTIIGDVKYLSGQTTFGAGSFRWWLDVETQNSWVSNTEMNVADLQGMVAALGYAGVASSQVGVYSTASQWNTITGTPTAAAYSVSNTLWGLNEWVTGARGQSGAESNCRQTPFTGGKIVVSQWFSHPYDGDYSCIG